MTLVSVIILNWNGRSYLDNCLESLESQTFTDFETILVDNGSCDDSVAHVRKKFPWVRLLELQENLGFAEGNNRGLAVARGSYIVTLNNDTKIAPVFLAELVKAAQSDPAIGMVAAKMLNYFQHDRIDSVGICPTTAGFGINIGVGETDAGQYDELPSVFGACAGAALYRREMLDKISFFDADFFAYYEDLDLAWRGRLAGWQAIFAPRAIAFHAHSATSGLMSAFTVYHIHRNKWYVLIKIWPATLLLQYLPLIIYYDFGSLVLAMLRGHILPALRARFHVICKLPLLFKKRAALAHLRLQDPINILRQLNSGGSPIKTFIRKLGSGI